MIDLIRGVITRVAVVMPLVMVMLFMALLEIDRIEIPGSDRGISFFALIGIIAAQHPFALWVRSIYAALARQRAKSVEEAERQGFGLT